MVRVYDIHHVNPGIRLIENPHMLTSQELEQLKDNKNQVMLDPIWLEPDELAVVYRVGENTGIPVVQREYGIRECPFDGMFNFNDGQYIGKKAGFSDILDELFERIILADQATIDVIALM